VPLPLLGADFLASPPKSAKVIFILHHLFKKTAAILA
jgi:hypothetical protein